MKVLILGAGAMGCLYGAALHRAGCEVVLVDVNRAHIDAINARGLELETRAGTELLPIPARLPAEIAEPADLVVVFTKTFHTDAALAGIAAAIGPWTSLLSLQNGLGNDQRLAAHASGDRILVGSSSLPSDLVGPGKVRSHGEGGSKLYPAFGGDPAFAQRDLRSADPRRPAGRARARHPRRDLVEGDLQRDDEPALCADPPHPRLPRIARRKPRADLRAGRGRRARRQRQRDRD